jgi:predicted metal-dependent peptidase
MGRILEVIEIKMTAQEKIEKAKAYILLSEPWFATILLNLRFQNDNRIPTMATDGTYLIWNSDFTLSLSDKEVEGVLMHEALHVALLHCFRRLWREPMRWNIAADMEVNSILTAHGTILPAGCVPPGPLNSLTEELYEKVKDSDASKFFRDVFDSGEFGDGEKSEGGEKRREGSGSLSEKDWKDILASQQGTAPAGISRIIDDLITSKRNWREELSEFFSSTTRSPETTWTKVSRRVSSLPGKRKEPEAKVAVCVDTSGSISGALLNDFMRECRAISALRGFTVILISGDAEVTGVFEASDGDTWPLTLTGGGGTSFIPCINKALDFEVDCIVYCTDGDGTYPLECPVPVLWVMTSDKKVPFGKLIKLKGESHE